MLFAAFAFAFMGAGVKLASDHYSTAEIVFCRGMVGMLFVLILMAAKGGTLKTPLPRQHMMRGGIGVVSLWLWFYSFTLLPMATATTLNYTSSIWIAAIMFGMGWWRGTQRLEWRLAATILLSFFGVALLLRPSVGASQAVGGMIALASGFISAMAYLQVRQLGQLGEPEYRVVFYFSMAGAVAGFCGCLLEGHMPLWHAHQGSGPWLLLGVGLSATLAQMAMTRAYRLGNTLVTANLQYTGIVFSSLLGIFFWGDLLDWLGWTGVTVILLSGILATFYNQRGNRSSDKAQALDPIAAEI
jgi:drug/metabolite transporter (DMT)-like permease